MVVFPARAGVILLLNGFNIRHISLSRTRGGDPPASSISRNSYMSFPHARG